MQGFRTVGRKVVLRIRNRVCESADELITSDLFRWVLSRFVEDLARRRSLLLEVFAGGEGETVSESEIDRFNQALLFLTKMPAELVPNVVPASECFFRDRNLLFEFVEELYNYWRGFERFIICDSQGDSLDRRPARTFNETIESLTHLVRGVYRNIEENITGGHPRIYRQVAAGAEVSTIALPYPFDYPEGPLRRLLSIPVIRQILMYPPLVLYPPQNKRTGRFERVDRHPLDRVHPVADEWLCYPALVGDRLIAIYFREDFYDLGFSLCNLFELAGDEDLKRVPDAVYLFGVDPGALTGLGGSSTVFYDGGEGPLVAAVPGEEVFGYFGYLKKMTLTLHNIVQMKEGRLPFHGALVRILLAGGRDVTILIVGDTGAGKSETLEAFRRLGRDVIQDLIVVADDMGSLQIDASGRIVGYGTEIGAFLRLDDLQAGFAFGQIDRSIIMNPHRVNARIILPVTSYETVIKGHRLDVILYANNYDSINEDHPLIERFPAPETALRVFREGTVMSKGTTTSTGLVHSYFANIFGPPQYRELHDALAEKFFRAFFDQGLFVGQMRTRLGISGWEQKGPAAAAEALLGLIRSGSL